MSKKKQNIPFTWWGNVDVNFPIFLAIAGFIFSILILDNGCGKEKGYHDIILGNKKEIVSKVINNRIDSLNSLINVLRPFENRSDTPINDTVKKKKEQLRIAIKSLNASIFEKRHLTFSNIDTSIKFYTKYLLVNRDTFLNSINLIGKYVSERKKVKNDSIVVEKNKSEDVSITTKGDKKVDSAKVLVAIMDTCSILSETPFLYEGTLVLKHNNRKTQFEFFSDYPIFGFWYFFSVAQMTLWFLLIAIVIGVARKAGRINDSVKDVNGNTKEVSSLVYSFQNASFFLIIPFVIVGLFTSLFYLYVVDKTVISDDYFLANYNWKMAWYAIPGYTVTIICFSIYLFISNKLDILDDTVEKNAIILNDNVDFKNRYSLLRSYFNATFLCTAIILSVFVFWVGLLFNAINSIEAMHFYSYFSGKNFLNYDFVYLLGLMHSLLLLIFYVPVRLRFNTLNITKNTDEVEKKTVSKRYWLGFLEILTTILVTTSPLIATLIQKAMSQFAE